MKELEDKIHEMIFLGVKEFAIVSHTPDSLTENITDIAKEIKDIAIDFAKYKEDFKPVANGRENLYQHPVMRQILTGEQIFDKFILERYKP